MRAADVMTSLTQLTATGYLVERRRDGCKWYSRNQERIKDTLGTPARFLGVTAKDGTT